MILVKSPLRVSFFGGGTDIPEFFNKYSGEVLSCTIDKYIYTSIMKLDSSFDENFRLNYSSSERVYRANDIKNNIIRETIKLMKSKNRLYISTIADVPLRSGLGSSSSFTASLICGLAKLNKISLTKYEIANLTCQLEINILKSPIGFQDQFASVYGGINRFVFTKEKTKIHKINLQNSVIKKIEESMILVFTGIQRNGNMVLRNQKLNIKNRIEFYNELKEISKNAYMYLKKTNRFNLHYFSDLLNESWQIKKQLSKNIENEITQKIIKSLKKSGALATKICGAGGGGFILVCAEKSSHKKIIKDHKKFKFYNFKISFEGTEAKVI